MWLWPQLQTPDSLESKVDSLSSNVHSIVDIVKQILGRVSAHFRRKNANEEHVLRTVTQFERFLDRPSFRLRWPIIHPCLDKICLLEAVPYLNSVPFSCSLSSEVDCHALIPLDAAEATNSWCGAIPVYSAGIFRQPNHQADSHRMVKKRKKESQL